LSLRRVGGGPGRQAIVVAPRGAARDLVDGRLPRLTLGPEKHAGKSAIASSRCNAGHHGKAAEELPRKIAHADLGGEAGEDELVKRAGDDIASRATRARNAQQANHRS
jgi:hypothetical protein